MCISELFRLVVVTIAACVGAYIMSACLHEIGHGAAGILSGGSVCFLRIGRWTWIRSAGWMYVRGLCGAGPGQCLVVCNGTVNFCVAAAGGCVVNAVTGLVALLWQPQCFGNGNEAERQIFRLCFGVISLLAAVCNWIMDGVREETDGAVYRKVKKEPHTAEIYLREQKLCAFLLEFGMVQELM